MIYCATLEKWGLWDTDDCCISCIEEMNEGYSEGCSLGSYTRTPILSRYSEVCCAAANGIPLERLLGEKVEAL